MAKDTWPCMICKERHSPDAHILDEQEMRYTIHLIRTGVITVPVGNSWEIYAEEKALPMPTM